MVGRDGDGVARDARAEEQIHDREALDLLEPRGDEDGDALVGCLLEHAASL